MRALTHATRILTALALTLTQACGDETKPVTDTSSVPDTGADVEAMTDAAETVGDDADGMTPAEDVTGDAGDSGDDDAVEPPTDVDDDASSPDATPTDTAPGDTSPPLDPNGDTDRDGIFDLDEVADGTDPFDPRSARAWHPEITGYPRLYAGPEDRADLVALTTDGGDGAALWARIVSESDKTAPTHPDATTFRTDITPSQGHIAEASALRGWLGDDATYIDKALDLLAAPFPDPTYLNERSQFNAGDHYNLYESQALVGFCGAWDFVRGYADAHPDAIATERLEAARDNLITRIDYFRRLCFLGGGCRALLRGEANNHSLKSLSGLGLCAMAVPDRPEAATDFNEALGAMDFIIQEVQGSPEGGWGENWNYLTYSGETHLALFAAWHRHANGDTWPVRQTGWVMPRDPKVGQIRDVEDFATNAVIRAVHRAAVYAAQPNGRTPPVDDGNPSALHGALLAGLHDDGIFHWNWNLPAVGRATGRTLVPSFIALADAPAAVEPAAPLDRFLADAGFSIFRSSWSADAVYLYMQHEPEKMRAGGQAHEHADNLSFLLHAYGEPLIIDPGYIDYANHLLVKYASDHNMILVDGVGQPFWELDPAVQIPPLGNAYLHDHATIGDQTSLIASTKYYEAEVRRRLVRVGDLGFVMADAVIAADGAALTWQLNGYASESINGTQYTREDVTTGVAAAFRWARPKAAIDVLVAATEGDAAAGDRLEENLNVSGRTQHRCATFDAVTRGAGGFLTLMVPTPTGTAAPTFEASRPAAGVVRGRAVLGSETIDAILNRGATPWNSNDAETPSVAPGTLWVRHTAADNARTEATWSMETPAIPDVESLLP